MAENGSQDAVARETLAAHMYDVHNRAYATSTTVGELIEDHERLGCTTIVGKKRDGAAVTLPTLPIGLPADEWSAAVAAVLTGASVWTVAGDDVPVRWHTLGSAREELVTIASALHALKPGQSITITRHA